MAGDSNASFAWTQERQVPIGVIGGSGLYHLAQFKLIAEVYPETPWGYPSASIRICKFCPSTTEDNSTPTEEHPMVAFLSRHGAGHRWNPSEVNYRANIAALKSIGVQVILAFSAVGSLREDIHPLDFVLPDQLVDRTKGIRACTFFENGCVGHVEFGDPMCAELAQLIYEQRDCLQGTLQDGVTPIRMHREKTLVVMEGPAFSTRAESKLYRAWGCDIINMSSLPEAKLAREAEIAYQVICMATDYDCWRGNDQEDVSVSFVLENLRKNAVNAEHLLLRLLPALEQYQRENNNGDGEGRMLRGEGPGAIRPGMNEFAMITAEHSQNPKQVEALRYLFPNYWK